MFYCSIIFFINWYVLGAALFLDQCLPASSIKQFSILLQFSARFFHSFDTLIIIEGSIPVYSMHNKHLSKSAGSLGCVPVPVIFPIAVLHIAFDEIPTCSEHKKSIIPLSLTNTPPLFQIPQFIITRQKHIYSTG